MADPITVKDADGNDIEVFTAESFNELNDRFTTTQGELTQWQQGIKKVEPTKAPEVPPVEPPKNPLTLNVEPTKTPDAIKIADFEAEFITNGSLSDEAMKKLTDAGYAEDVVNVHLNAKKTQADTDLKTVLDAVGGEDNFNLLREWANTNLDDNQKIAYEAILATGNAQAMASHLQNLKLQMDAKEGTPPANNLNGKDITNTPAVEGFKSQSEITEARRSEKYKTDPDYRKQVDHRMFLTDPAILGWHQDA